MKRFMLAFSLLVASVTQADAHAHLVAAMPPVGGEVPSVGEIRLTFSEGVEVPFSTIKLANAAGEPLSTPGATTDPQDGHILRLLLPKPLEPGAYKLSWSVVSVDTHHTSGSFTFSVRP
jgi:hypothetical protein